MEKKPKKCVHKYVNAGAFDRNGGYNQANLGYTVKIAIIFCEKCGDIQSKTV